MHPKTTKNDTIYRWICNDSFVVKRKTVIARSNEQQECFALSARSCYATLIRMKWNLLLNCLECVIVWCYFDDVEKCARKVMSVTRVSWFWAVVCPRDANLVIYERSVFIHHRFGGSFHIQVQLNFVWKWNIFDQVEHMLWKLAYAEFKWMCRSMPIHLFQ